MVHIGLDLHQRNSYVRALTDDGELTAGQRIDHSNIDRLWQYLSEFGDEPKRVVFEATGNSRWMKNLLSQDPTIEAVAVTPHKVRIIAETVAKTDKIDSGVLALLSKLDVLPAAWLPDEGIEELREVTRHRAKLVQLRTRAKNQSNGLLMRRGLLRPHQDIFGKLGRVWLSELELPKQAQLQLETWLNLIDIYDEKIAEVEKYMYYTLAKQERWANDLAILQSMPAWGRLTAMTVLAELGDYRRFRRRSAVSCFAGLVPSSKRSDKSCRYGKITKRGSTALRSILVEVAITAVRKVPRYGALYDRVKLKKGGNAAKVAVARAMLEDGWTMLIKQEPFRFMPVQAANLSRVG